MDSAPSKMPWDDLRYLIGEIMYGGHIVNDFDRLLCNCYLDFYLRDELLDEMELYPYGEEHQQGGKAAALGLSFKAPAPTTYDMYLKYVETNMVGDSPVAFGLHPNAEIGFRTDSLVQRLWEGEGDTDVRTAMQGPLPLRCWLLTPELQ